MRKERQGWGGSSHGHARKLNRPRIIWSSRAHLGTASATLGSHRESLNSKQTWALCKEKGIGTCARCLCKGRVLEGSSLPVGGGSRASSGDMRGRDTFLHGEGSKKGTCKRHGSSRKPGLATSKGWWGPRVLKGHGQDGAPAMHSPGTEGGVVAFLTKPWPCCSYRFLLSVWQGQSALKIPLGTLTTSGDAPARQFPEFHSRQTQPGRVWPRSCCWGCLYGQTQPLPWNAERLFSATESQPEG